VFRCVSFHGQHTLSTGTLLDVTDSEFKDAMGRVAQSDMDFWKAAEEDVKAKLMEDEKESVSAAHESKSIAENLRISRERAARSHADSSEWNASIKSKIRAAQSALERASVELKQCHEDVDAARSELSRAQLAANLLRVQHGERQSAAAPAACNEQLDWRHLPEVVAAELKKESAKACVTVLEERQRAARWATAVVGAAVVGTAAVAVADVVDAAMVGACRRRHRCCGRRSHVDEAHLCAHRV